MELYNNCTIFCDMSHAYLYNLYNNQLFILLLIQFKPAAIFATIAQFVYLIRIEGIFFWVQSTFSVILWIYAYLFQIATKELRPNYYCLHTLDDYGLPSSEHVYVISIFSSILLNDIVMFKKNGLRYSLLAIPYEIFWLIFTCLQCWMVGDCTVKQNFFTVFMGVVPTIIFMPLMYVFIIKMMKIYDPVFNNGGIIKK